MEAILTCTSTPRPYGLRYIQHSLREGWSSHPNKGIFFSLPSVEQQPKLWDYSDQCQLFLWHKFKQPMQGCKAWEWGLGFSIHCHFQSHSPPRPDLHSIPPSPAQKCSLPGMSSHHHLPPTVPHSPPASMGLNSKSGSGFIWFACVWAWSSIFRIW